MRNRFIVPLNLSKLGFRYFRIIFESKYFSKKFIDFIVSHPNTGFVFEGAGWSGKKRILGIGIWATSNSEMSDIATNIRSVIPDSYKVVYQSELTRLEYFCNTEESRKRMVLLDELENKVQLSAVELDYLKLLSTDASLSNEENASLLKISVEDLESLDAKLRKDSIFYGRFPNSELPSGYTKFFIDTTAISKEMIDSFLNELRNDSRCVYIARGNGKYNIEIEYIIEDESKFNDKYVKYLKHSKCTQFDRNIYTNLFPQSKSLNTKMVQERFVELAKYSDKHFDLTDSELWYINHEGTQSYLDIYSNEKYNKSMKTGELSLFDELVQIIPQSNHFNLIDLGSGDGVKGRILAECIGEERIKAYFPVDIQELELSQAVYAHEGAKYTIHPTLVEFKNLKTRFPIAGDSDSVNIYVLLGGTYGNFERNEINRYINDILITDKDYLIVTMPITDFSTREDIENAYYSKEMQNISFGVLRQIGFVEDDFVRNDKFPNLRLHLKWVDDNLVHQYVLAESKIVKDVHLEKGVIFDVTTSWKPNLSLFKESLTEDFDIVNIFSNKSNAVAICKRKSDTLKGDGN